MEAVSPQLEYQGKSPVVIQPLQARWIRQNFATPLSPMQSSP